MIAGIAPSLRALRARQWVLLGTTLALLVEDLGPAELFVKDAAGLWLVFGAPIAIWYGLATRVVSSKDAAALVALSFGLVTDMVVVLGLNELLPLGGDQHPLTRPLIAVSLAVVVIVLGGFLPEGTNRFASWRPPSRELLTVGGAGALCLVLSVAGPIRLNNGFGSDVSIVAVVCLTGLLVMLLVRRRLSTAAVEIGIYCVALSLLLLTSLRGWLITGHDIQKEYYYFELALNSEHWDVRTYSDAFNACLSITLLPVSVVKLTTISGEYAFKLIIPMLFAAVPVMIFRTVRNVAPHRISVLSASFFVMFPTYFTDMPYIARQEVAFVILGSAMLLVTERRPRLRDRRIAFLVLMAGLALAHYSTTYILVIVIGLAVFADLCWRTGSALRARKERSRPRRSRRTRESRGSGAERGLLAWWMLPLVVGFALLWAGPATDTGGQLKSTLTAAVQEVSGTAAGQSGSSGTSYSLFGSASETDQQRLADYRTQSITEAAPARQVGSLLPISVVDQYSAPYVSPATLPLTSVGRLMKAFGVNVGSVNSLVRSLAAYLMQFLIVMGLAAAWLRRRRKGFRPVRDQVTLTIGALGMLALLTLVPQLSVDYSVLRGFQQGIIFFAPFMALGVFWALSWLRRWTVPAICALVAALVLDLSGVVPRVTGDYPAQLSMSNSGQYYDIYYPTASEQAAAHWLVNRIKTAGPDSGSSLIQTDQYTASRLQTILPYDDVAADIYPTLLHTYAYTLLGSQTVQKGQVTIFYRGDLVTYQYPTALLNSVYNEIYASNGAEVFQ